MMQALGLIEVIGYPAAVEAADAALKASNVQLSGISKVGSGIMTVQLFGDVGAITAAVDAGGKAAERIGNVRSVHVIPRVDESLIGTLVKRPISANKQEEVTSVNEAESLAKTIEPSKQILNNINLNNAQERDNPDAVVKEATTSATSEEVISLDDLSKKNNDELKALIHTLGIDVPSEKLKTAKKAELIRMITEFRK